MKLAHGKKVILRIMLIYTLVVGVWTIASDYFIAVHVKDSILSANIYLAKGLMTVLATAGLLHITLNYYYGKLQKSEEALRVSWKQLRTLINNLPDAVFFKDSEGRWLEANTNALQVFQLQPDYKGKTYAELAAESELYARICQHCQESDQMAWETKRVLLFESEVIQRDGSKRVYEVVKAPLFYPSGAEKGMAVIGRDVTDRKKTEEALRESDAKYRLIADNMSDLICILDCQGLVQYASPSHESVLGVNVKDYEGSTVFVFVHPEDLPAAEAKVKKLIETRMQQEIQARIRYADGRYGIFEVKGMPVFDNTGHVEKIVVIASDITERVKAEEMLRKSEKLSVVGQLAAGVAHEIRNPLTALKGFVQLLQSNNDKFQNYYEVMMSELDRINTIVSEFLFLAKPQAAQFERKDIRVLINNILALLETHAIMSNVRIITDFAADIPAVNCEENQLKQVFINVLKNAIEAMPDGGEVLIQVRMQGPATVSIRFQDNGMGIPRDRIPQLGEPFYTTKEKGTGLGLMVSFKIIEAHKGNITISSEINNGTIVDIALPV